MSVNELIPEQVAILSGRTTGKAINLNPDTVNNCTMSELVTIEITIFWLIGITITAICLILQLVLFSLIPSCRKLDLKILTQITIARLINTAFEFIIMKDLVYSTWTLFASNLLYSHSDCALVCWMFLFSKNLYDKVVQVFTTKKMTFALKSVIVWLITLPVGVLFPIFTFNGMFSNDYSYLSILYKSYAILKFVILIVNLLFFCRIFYVAITRRISGNNQGVMRTCVISFILVSISSLQVLLTDFLSYFGHHLVTIVFSVVNSYQVLLVMVIFVNLVRGFSGETLQKSITKTFHSTSTTT